MKNNVVEVMLNRGYSVPIILDDESFNCNDIVILGNYSKSEYNATPVVSKYGIAPTVRENHGQVTAILEVEDVDS